MAYTGHVEAGSGEPSERELPGLTVAKVSVGPVDNNCYLLTCMATGDRLLIDAANDAGVLIGLAPVLDTIVTTHQHPDHWQALAEVAEATGAPTVAHPLDAPGLPVEPSALVEQDDVVRVGEQELRVIHLRGHTPGSIALHWSAGDESHLFVGDCLFPGGVGNTQKDPARFAQLLDDVESRIFDVLPESTWVYPGHGDDTTICTERPHLAEWRARGW